MGVIQPVKHVDYTLNILDIENEIERACVDKLYMDSAKDLKTAPESNFVYVLGYVADKLFKDTDIFKSEPNINNAFNTDKLMPLLDIYLDLCIRFNKTPSLWSFCRFVPVDYASIKEKYIDNNIYNNINNNIQSSNSNYSDLLNAPSTSWGLIHKKILIARNDTLRAKLSDGKQNPVGIIALMNNEYNFNGDKPESEQDRKCLSVNDLRSLLSVTSGQHRIQDYSKSAQKNVEMQ